MDFVRHARGGFDGLFLWFHPILPGWAGVGCGTALDTDRGSRGIELESRDKLMASDIPDRILHFAALDFQVSDWFDQGDS